MRLEASKEEWGMIIFAALAAFVVTEMMARQWQVHKVEQVN